MRFKIDLEYTPFCPQDGMPYTESSFVRKSLPIQFDVSEVGVALVDMWNYGWEGGPIVESLGAELSLERGRSHAQRKRQITESVIAPTVNELRGLGVQIFHCNQWEFLKRYPQWGPSTTEEERRLTADFYERISSTSDRSTSRSRQKWPPTSWIDEWKGQHRELVWRIDSWASIQGKAYERIDIPKPVQPQEGDLLVYSGDQFHRLLMERQIRVLFYMGFEADECIRNKGHDNGHGIDDMHRRGYLCVIVRDCTTTYEAAETLDGLWRTKAAIISIERGKGYSIASQDLLDAARGI